MNACNPFGSSGAPVKGHKKITTLPYIYFPKFRSENIYPKRWLSFNVSLVQMVLVLKFLNTTAAVDKFLLASKERMAC